MKISMQIRMTDPINLSFKLLIDMKWLIILKGANL